MRRYVSLLVLAAATLSVAVVVAGCGDSRSVGDSRSILYAGDSGGASAVGHSPPVVTDAEAVRAGRTVHAFWLSNLASGALGPTSNQSPQQFRLRLASAANRYGFTVERVRFVEARGQVAPLVIVETRSYLAFARATPAIVNSLDPQTDQPNHATGENFWTFPGLYLEAKDERGVPFLIVDDFPGAGGQWARSDQLYPYGRA